MNRDRGLCIFDSADEVAPPCGVRISFSNPEAAMEFCKRYQWAGVLASRPYCPCGYVACANRLAAHALLIGERFLDHFTPA